MPIGVQLQAKAPLWCGVRDTHGTVGLLYTAETGCQHEVVVLAGWLWHHVTSPPQNDASHGPYRGGGQAACGVETAIGLLYLRVICVSYRSDSGHDQVPWSFRFQYTSRNRR
jgi:hypothetical protein